MDSNKVGKMIVPRSKRSLYLYFAEILTVAIMQENATAPPRDFFFFFINLPQILEYIKKKKF